MYYIATIFSSGFILLAKPRRVLSRCRFFPCKHILCLGMCWDFVVNCVSICNWLTNEMDLIDQLVRIGRYPF